MQVKATEKCFVNNTIHEPGAVFDFDGEPDGKVLVPVDDESPRQERRARGAKAAATGVE
jgi:hypothetical protein